MDLITEKPSPHTETQEEMAALQSSRTSPPVDPEQDLPQSSLPRPQPPPNPGHESQHLPSTSSAPQPQSQPAPSTAPAPQSPLPHGTQLPYLPDTQRAIAKVSTIFSDLSNSAEVSIKMLGMADKKPVPITGRHQEMAATVDNTAHTPYPGGELRSTTSGRERRTRLRSATEAHSASAGPAVEHSQPVVRLTLSSQIQFHA
jgi:Predicted membrane protein